MSKKDMFIAIMLNVVWGGSFTFAGYAVLFYAPLFLYALRFLSTGLITAPINRTPLSKIPLLILLATFQAIDFSGIAMGVKHIDSSTTAILTRLDVPFTIILGVLFFKEKMTLKTVIGLILCFFAVYIISGGIELTQMKYIFLMIFSSFCSGCANIVAKKITGLDNKTIVSWASLFMGIEMLTVSLLTEDKLIIKPLNTWAILDIVYLGIISSYLTYLVLYYLLRRYETSTIMPYNFLRPIVSIVLGFLMLGEPITSNKVIGVILILSGVYLSQYHYNKKNVLVKMVRTTKCIIIKRHHTHKIEYKVER